MSIDQVQFIVAVIAVVLQMIATIMAQPFKALLPVKAWRCLITLNFFILARRIVGLVVLETKWSNEVYDNISVLIGLGVSVFMLMSIISIRKHLIAERAKSLAVAKATLAMIQEAHNEDSLAYRLALHFIAAREGHESEIVNENDKV